MRVAAVVLAAGSGSRFGSDKVVESLGGKPLWRWSFDAFLAHPDVEWVGLVASETNFEAIRSAAGEAAFVRVGGQTRIESSRIACECAPAEADAVLIHDAARPFVSRATVDRVLSAIERVGAAAPAVGVADTVRRVSPGEVSVLDRSSLRAMQTPQGARKGLLLEAHRRAAESSEATDDLALLEAIGQPVELVEGDERAFKITTPDDLLRARAMLGAVEIRTGLGYDVHRFSDDPARELWLGCVKFEGHRGLEGHSDADAVAHAAVDALLGAAALGDIGIHFPNSDPRWKGEPSSTFLKRAGELLRSNGWEIRNLDVAIVAETPKVSGMSLAMRERMAAALGVGVDRVSVKATTNEGLGSIGRSEGIVAFATATIARA